MSDDLLHGGSLDRMRAAFPDASEPWLDLSTGINPWPYPVEPASADALHHLPTREAYTRCLAAMAKAMGAPAESMRLSPGSELLIRLLPKIISPEKTVVLSPSYGDHQQVWNASSTIVIESADALTHADTADAIVLCNPNNPDGRVFSLDELEMARARLAKRGGWLIVDEAYADLNPGFSLAPCGGAPGLIILRSFGKFFGLAGVRLGAVMAPMDLLDAFDQLLGVWPVSGNALEIGAVAYSDMDWQADMRRRLSERRKRLDEILSAHRLGPVQGTDLFRYVTCEDAHTLWRGLAQQGIYVRRFAWSNRHLRIGLPGSDSDEARLNAALSLSV
ncbi:threonine-phosphate decarboxylase CobD [Hyphomonas atlantica]|uniref:threonine-phosphate decarboxylase CobD n=1 Tax=Hyphomonas atlantica TaxID=1280948 RepID=UPI0032B14FDC